MTDLIKMKAYIICWHEPNSEQMNPTKIGEVYTSKEELEKAYPKLAIQWVEPRTSYQIAGYADNYWILERTLVFSPLPDGTTETP